MPEIDYRGGPATYREAGMDRPGTPVLLAHCSLAHGGMWKPVIAALAETRPVIAPDLPAHGGTAPPPEGASLQLHAAGLCEALAERFGRPAHVVGLSLGGAVLGRLALARPDLAASLTLIEPVWFHLLAPAGMADAAAQETAMGAAIDACAAAGDWMGAARAFVEAWGAPGGFDALGPEGRAYAARCLPHVRRDFEMVTGHPPGQIEAADVARLAMPTMLMAGAETHRPAHAVLDVVQRALPGARRRAIAGAGHLSPATHPHAVLAELTAFFDAVEAGSV